MSSPPSLSPDHHLSPLLRSVSLATGARHAMKPLYRPSENGPPTASGKTLLFQAVQANLDSNQLQKQKKPAPSPLTDEREEATKAFAKWSHQQTLALLPRLGTDHPILPSHFQLPNVPLPEILMAIGKALSSLRAKNIAFDYRPHVAEHGCIELSSVHCPLKFVIQLWLLEEKDCEGISSLLKSDSNPSDESDILLYKHNKTIIVELQRRRGCPVLMHHLRRPLFQALAMLELKHRHPLQKNKLSCNYGSKRKPHRLAPTRAFNGLPKACSLPSLNDDSMNPRHTTKLERPSQFPPPLRLNLLS